MMQCAHAQAAGEQAVSTIRFELPAQPLQDAINAYGQLADMAVLVDSGVLAGRTSSAVSGAFRPRDALQRLLAGTGLRARFPGPDEAIIEVSPAASVRDVPASPLVFASDVAGLEAGGADAVAYAGMLQSRLTDALCQSPATRPGAYRLLMQLNIGPTGAIVAARLLGTTGDGRRDAAIEHAVRALELDSGPPAALRQPTTVLLRLQTDGVVSVCSSTADARP
ncbi:secretin and TonB N terminus short domain protein [Burkholderia sp. Ac-20353]|nr:secretin and TonB N terminus short domain protein [Burkholderia sp. Ac-20353]